MNLFAETLSSMVYKLMCMYIAGHDLTCVPFFMRIWKPLLYRKPAGMYSSCKELHANKNILVGPVKSQAFVNTMNQYASSILCKHGVA